MYTIQHFIDKFSAIPSYKWCAGKQCNIIGQKCAFGFITPNIERNTPFSSSEGIPEMEALEEIGNKYLATHEGQRVRHFAAVNNGDDERFQQKTCKARVIAALKWAQQKEEQGIIDDILNSKILDDKSHLIGSSLPV